MSSVPQLYPLWEDSIGEKHIVLTRINNPQHVYIANYPWVIHAEHRHLRIQPDFQEEINAECHFKIKIRYKDHEIQVVKQPDPSVPIVDGVVFEIVEIGWESIDIVFRVSKINGIEYIGPTTEPYFSATVTVDYVKVHVDVERLHCESEVFSEMKAISKNSEIVIYDLDADDFLELLRVINPPHKLISRFNFIELLLLATRFRMTRLLLRLGEFAKTPEYDPKWISKWTLKKIDRILKEDASETIQVIDQFRAKKRAAAAGSGPLKSVKFWDPEVQVIEETESEVAADSCFDRIVEYCSKNKSRIIYTLLILLFIENLMLFVWFTSAYRMGNF